MKARTTLLLLAVFIGSMSAAPRPEEPDLRRILGDDAVASRWIYDDWEAAREEAERLGKPVFALFRCVP